MELQAIVNKLVKLDKEISKRSDRIDAIENNPANYSSDWNSGYNQTLKGNAQRWIDQHFTAIRKLEEQRGELFKLITSDQAVDAGYCIDGMDRADFRDAEIAQEIAQRVNQRDPSWDQVRDAANAAAQHGDKVAAKWLRDWLSNEDYKGDAKPCDYFQSSADCAGDWNGADLVYFWAAQTWLGCQPDPDHDFVSVTQCRDLFADLSGVTLDFTANNLNTVVYTLQIRINDQLHTILESPTKDQIIEFRYLVEQERIKTLNNDQLSKVYILQVCADDGETVQETIKRTADKFAGEYGYLVKQLGRQKAVADWLAGLALNIEYRNYYILDLAVKTKGLPVDHTDSQGQKIIDNYFSFMAAKLIQLWDGYRVPSQDIVNAVELDLIKD